MKIAAVSTIVAILASGCIAAGPFAGSGTPLGDLVASVDSSSSAFSMAPQQVITAPQGSFARHMAALNLPQTRGTRVPYRTSHEPGTIVIETARPGLYVVEDGGMATKYPVAVGRAQHQWFGTKAVESIHFKPAWTAPEVIARANPNAAGVVIPGGAPNNPMGVGALVLTGGEYAIHGTNRPNSIGQAVSFGCFRMFNEDIADVIKRTRVGAKVVVVR